MKLFKDHQKKTSTAFRVALLLSVLLNGILLFLTGGIYTPAGQISSVSRTISLVSLSLPPEKAAVPETVPAPPVEPEPEPEPEPRLEPEPEPEPERQVEPEKVPELQITEQHDPEHNPDGSEAPSGVDERGPDKSPPAAAPPATVPPVAASPATVQPSEKPKAKDGQARPEPQAKEKNLAKTTKIRPETEIPVTTEQLSAVENLPGNKKPAPMEAQPDSEASLSSNALNPLGNAAPELPPVHAIQPPALSEKDRLWLETSQLAMLADTDLQGVNASHEDYFENASRQKFINYYLAEMERQIMAVWPSKRWPKGLSGSIRFELDPQGYLLSAVVHLPTAMPEFDRAILRAVQSVKRYRVPDDPSIAARYYSNLRFDYNSFQPTTETAPWETGATQRLHMSR